MTRFWLTPKGVSGTRTCHTRPYDVAVDTRTKVTPFAMNVGGSSCPAWLHQQLQVQTQSAPFLRWDIRNRLLVRLRDAHATMCSPAVAALLPAQGGLLPEQGWFYNRFAETYCRAFAGEPGELRMHGCESNSTFERRKLMVGGAVDLLLTRPDGTPELRQFEMWGGRLDADPRASWEMGLAVLRLYNANRELGDLVIRHVDLLSGEIDQFDFKPSEHLAGLAASLDSEVDELRSRASSPVTIPGRSCGRCQLGCVCGEWTGRPRARPIAPDAARTDYVGPIVKLNPTSLQRWLACPRAYRAAHLLDLPTGSPSPRSTQGLAVHARLAKLHEHGPCSLDPAARIEAATVNGVLNETLLGFLNRHARRCPANATSVGHELDLAQLHTWGGVPAMVTARIDAVWLNGGVLDGRDYKTGSPRYERVADDPAARLQVWLLAQLADKMGVGVRLRYEHLVEGLEEDPEPFEPDAEDIAQIQSDIGEVAAAIAVSEFPGVSDVYVCRRCAFQRACPDAVLEEPEEDDDLPDDFVLWAAGIPDPDAVSP